MQNPLSACFGQAHNADYVACSAFPGNGILGKIGGEPVCLPLVGGWVQLRSVCSEARCMLLKQSPIVANSKIKLPVGCIIHVLWFKGEQLAYFQLDNGYTGLHKGSCDRPNKHHRTGNDRVACPRKEVTLGLSDSTVTADFKYSMSGKVISITYLGTRSIHEEIGRILRRIEHCPRDL